LCHRATIKIAIVEGFAEAIVEGFEEEEETRR
jgi:hypothetical protein